jgi:hypothetical protein
MEHLTKNKKAFLDEAISIGTRLLSKAKSQNDGIYWETISMEPDQKIGSQVSETLYSGSAGIGLFFIELYRHTGNYVYLKTAESAFKWVIGYCNEHPNSNYAFFTGRTGVAYALLKLSQVTGNAKYRQEALRLMKNCRDFLNLPYVVDDVINGSSGTLLGLIHLHASTGEDELLSLIDVYLGKLINSAHIAGKGLYWDRSHQQISGLCGFSHGAGGIGYVFLQAGRYFSNPSLYWFAEQAFSYENGHFSKQHNNWKDLRKGAFSETEMNNFRQKYLANELDFFTQTSDMNAWCHGAAGIGLSRLSAVELLGSPVYKKDLNNAIAKTRSTDLSGESAKRSYTLCHGVGGNADLFLNAYIATGRKDLMESAEKAGLMALESFRKNGFYHSGFASAGTQEDQSLFMGIAGVGYFLLRLADPALTGSILSPSPEGKAGNLSGQFSYINMEESRAREVVLNKSYRRTYLLMQETGELDKTAERSLLASKDPVREFGRIMKAYLRGRKNDAAKEIFSLESTRLKMDLSEKSHALLYHSQKIKLEQASEAGSLENLRLHLDTRVRLKPLKYKYLVNDDRLQVNREKQYVLLRNTTYGMYEEPLSEFSHIVLSSFKKPSLVKRVMDGLVSDMDEENRKLVKKAVEQQIQNALAGAILVMD